MFFSPKFARAALIAAFFLGALPAAGQEPAPAGPPVLSKPWTGDLDGMIKRRAIRVLTVYNKTNFFIEKGNPHGSTYDAIKAFETELNKSRRTKSLSVHCVFIPTAREDLVPALLEGRGDIAAGNIYVTAERKERVDFSEPALSGISQIAVTGPGAPPLTGLGSLSGKTVFVRQGSSMHLNLERLNSTFEKAGQPPVRFSFAPEHLEDEDLLEMTNAGLIKIIVVNDFLAAFWKQVFPDITLHPDIEVDKGGQIAWMFRKNSPLLKAEVDAFLRRHPKGSLERNMLFQSYLKNTRWVKNPTTQQEMLRYRQLVEFFKKYARQYELDYLMMAAQGYQESKLDQAARNPSGAIGVMQVLPSTGAEMNVGDITKTEPNIHAGVKYIRFMMDKYYADEPMDKFNKVLFTFASYNAGPGRVSQMRREAARRGLNPNLWFNNVEVVALETTGRETVQYISNIGKYYLAYKLVTEEQEARLKAKEGLKKS